MPDSTGVTSPAGTIAVMFETYSHWVPHLASRFGGAGTKFTENLADVFGVTRLTFTFSALSGVFN